MIFSSIKKFESYNSKKLPSIILLSSVLLKFTFSNFSFNKIYLTNILNNSYNFLLVLNSDMLIADINLITISKGVIKLDEEVFTIIFSIFSFSYNKVKINK